MLVEVMLRSQTRDSAARSVGRPERRKELLESIEILFRTTITMSCRFIIKEGDSQSEATTL